MANILQTIESATGNQYKKTASTHGGEYKGPCPYCGGDDRFSIHPTNDHYVCRRCKKAGDTLQFYMDYNNLPYLKACLEAGQEPKFNKPTTVYDRVAKEEKWVPRENTRPSLTWQSKAEAVAFQSFKYLMSSAGKTHREYLHNRGISINSIKSARLGYNPTALSFDRVSWGLDPEQNKTGGQKSIWIPEGFIIPFFQDSKIVRIRIRQSDPAAQQRYILVAGSSTEYMAFPDTDTDTGTGINQDVEKTAFMVEAELDAILCNQEFGDLAEVYAIGNTTTRPDIQTHGKIAKKRIVLCLDNDNAGKEEMAWWTKQYGKQNVDSHPVPKEFGKDPGEAFQGGLNLKQWVKDIVGQASRNTALKSAKKRSETAISKKEEIKRQIIISNVDQETNSVNPVSKICLYGQHCVSAKNGVCLISKQNMIDMTECPKKFWYAYGTENIRQIIYGVNFKK